MRYNMKLHLGNNMIISTKDIIGMFDIEKTSVKKDVKEFLKDSTNSGRVVNVSFDMPKTFIICKVNDNEKIYITPISVNTLIKRIEAGEYFE